MDLKKIVQLLPQTLEKPNCSTKNDPVWSEFNIRKTAYFSLKKVSSILLTIDKQKLSMM